MFAQWEDLVFLLRPPVEAYSGMQAEPAWDMMDLPVLEAQDKSSPEVSLCRGSLSRDQSPAAPPGRPVNTWHSGAQAT